MATNDNRKFLEKASMQAGSIVASACSSAAGNLQQEFVRQKQHDHMCHGKNDVYRARSSQHYWIILKMGTLIPINGKIASLFVGKNACFDHGTHGGEPQKRLGNPIARCVCVWTICTDVKLPCLVDGCFSILHYNCRGPGTHHCLSWPTKTRQYGGENVPAFSLWWDVANPRTTMPVFSCIRTFLRTSVSTGFNPLYGFRNLNYCWFRQMEQLLFARTMKEFIFMGFSLPCPPTFACQTLGDCLCTPDALHISNSIRYFWASVSLIPLSDKVVWALRGKPF